MKQRFTNFSYTLLDSTSTYFKEVIVTFDFEGKTYHGFLFIRKGINVNYINEAKKIIKKEIENGTLLKNTKKQKKKGKPLLVFFTSALALTSVVFASLFAYQYLIPNVTPGGGGGGGDDPTVDFTKEEFNNALAMNNVKALKVECNSVIESEDFEMSYQVEENRDFNVGYYHIGIHEVLPTNDNFDDKYFRMEGEQCYEYRKERTFGLYIKEESESSEILDPEQFAKKDVDDEGIGLTKLKYEDFDFSKKEENYIAKANKAVPVYIPAFHYCFDMGNVDLKFNSEKQLISLHSGAFVEDEGDIKNVFNFKYGNYDPFIPELGEFYYQLGCAETSEADEFKNTLTKNYPTIDNENVPVHIECISSTRDHKFTYEYDRKRIAQSYDGDELYTYYNREDDNNCYIYEHDEEDEYNKRGIGLDEYKREEYLVHFLTNGIGVYTSEGGFNHNWDFGNFKYNDVGDFYSLKSIESVPIRIEIPFLDNHECDVQISFKGTILDGKRENRIECILLRDTEESIDYKIEFEYYNVEVFLPDDFI